MKARGTEAACACTTLAPMLAARASTGKALGSAVGVEVGSGEVVGTLVGNCEMPFAEKMPPFTVSDLRVPGTLVLRSSFNFEA